MFDKLRSLRGSLKTDRFSLGPILAEALGGLRHRRVHEDEPRDWGALILLLGVPLGLGFLSAVLGWRIRSADSLLAGFALLAGVLLTVFVQISVWRERLRPDGKHEALALYEGPPRRSADEAAAHTLLASVLSIVGAVVLVVLDNVSQPAPDGVVVIPWVAIVLTAFMVGLSAYLVLTFILIVNLLFDAYQVAQGPNSPSQGAGRNEEATQGRPQ